MAKMICSTCGSIGEPKTITRGSFAIEIILWLCFIVPGIIYSLWRLTTRRSNGCGKCGAQTMIPLNSPMGTQLMKTLGNQEAGQTSNPTDRNSLAYKMGQALAGK